MNKQQFAERVAETLRPFETANLVDTVQHLTINQVLSHPAVLFFICIVFFFGVIKRSKSVLLALFALFCLVIIMRYALPVPGDDLNLKSMLPFVGGGLITAGVIIYFSLIKSE